MTSTDPKWKMSDLSINDTLSMPGRTLEHLYSNNSDEIGYIMYNDQADKVTLIKGHTKGIILFNQNQAIWIVHSIPNFPPKKSFNQYFIRPPQCIFGQSMLCMSFSIDKLATIGKQLLYTYPQIFDYYVPDKLKYSPTLSNLINVINGARITSPPWYNYELLTTVGGEKMMSFAKITEFNQDLYSGLVASNLKSNLFTETWNNGAGTLKSNCSSSLDYHVLNIEKVKFSDFNLEFSVHHDHSKWAVTSLKDSKHFDFEWEFDTAEEIKIPCVSDINRQIEQFKRAGGCVCFIENSQVWKEYYNLVDTVETCDRNRFKKKVFKSSQTNESIILL